VADLPGSGEADNLDVAKQRATEALVEAQQAVDRIGPMRSMYGILGFSAAILEATQAIERLTVALGAVMLGDDNDVYRAYLEDRLGNEVRGNGD
jgi:hypothetical protein